MVGSRSGKQAKAEFAKLQMKHGGTIRDEIHGSSKGIAPQRVCGVLSSSIIVVYSTATGGQYAGGYTRTKSRIGFR